MAAADTPVDNNESAGTGNAEALAMFDAKLAAIAATQTERIGRKNMWLAHHWPDHYAERCAVVGGRHVCRRCGALYPFGFLVAFASAYGLAPYPEAWDPIAIWILCIPATIAYCGEAIGAFAYNPRWQVGAMLVTALGFGRGLGYELVERWSPEFWGPVAVFGGLWFMFTMFGLTRKRAKAHRETLAQLKALAERSAQV